MTFSNSTGRYYQKSNEYPKRISWKQLFVLHVAATYKLRHSDGWWLADGHEWPDGIARIHYAATIKSLLSRGLLEGNDGGKSLALGGRQAREAQQEFWRNWNVRMERPPMPMLWASAKGRKLIDKIGDETGLVFDKQNYKLRREDRLAGLQ